jgi:hypothetical protein
MLSIFLFMPFGFFALLVVAMLLYPGDGHVGRESVEIDREHLLRLRGAGLEEHELGRQHFVADPRPCASITAFTSASPATFSTIRSLTANPDSFRIRCTRLTTSRACPSRLSSGVTVGSIAAKKPASS